METFWGYKRKPGGIFCLFKSRRDFEGNPVQISKKILSRFRKKTCQGIVGSLVSGLRRKPSRDFDGNPVGMWKAILSCYRYVKENLVRVPNEFLSGFPRRPVGIWKEIFSRLVRRKTYSKFKGNLLGISKEIQSGFQKKSFRNFEGNPV